MKKQPQHSNGKRISLEGLAQPGLPEVPQGYFESLEARLQAIPSQATPLPVFRLRPWLIGLSTMAAAMALLLLLYRPITPSSAIDPPQDATLAWLEEQSAGLDEGMMYDLTQAAVEEISGTPETELTDAWAGHETILAETEDEDIAAYLEDHTELHDIIINL
ncbi:MAG TPA: hypothetical protein P5550_00805 [Bacteroidales bacterium]|nr:hypothetical protein [Bacteroidales bacterium]HRZ77143.1 hypothetical protein [Bacteroidales bacterium]